MWIGLVLLVGAVFGGVDQYIGSIATLSWGASLSLLSAPWLLIAFLAGWTRRNPRSAAVYGLACTYAALVGYCLMTLSPIEGAQRTVHSVFGLCRGESPVLAGALVTGPLFGWFGHRWRMARDWIGSATIALAFCLEPFAEHTLKHSSWPVPTVTTAEVAVGIIMSDYVIGSIVRHRSAARSR